MDLQLFIQNSVIQNKNFSKHDEKKYIVRKAHFKIVKKYENFDN